MYKKTVTYEDFNGVTRTDSFYFNLTKFELLKLEAVKKGGLGAYVEGISKSENSAAAMIWIDEFMGHCYGIKGDDGLGFDKSEAIMNSFRTTEAYSVIISELLEDPDKMSEFFEGVMPQALMKNYYDSLEKYGSAEKAIEGTKAELAERQFEDHKKKGGK